MTRIKPLALLGRLFKKPKHNPIRDIEAHHEPVEADYYDDEFYDHSGY